MYIKRIEIENIKSFGKFKWELNDDENPAGWHVLLGRNGCGKSTFIKCASVALMGPNEAMRSRASFKDWIKKGQESGTIRIEITQDVSIDIWGTGGNKNKGNITFSTKVTSDNQISKQSRPADPDRTLWSGKKGWFSASYGPFRRFSGGNNDYTKLFYSSPLLARHLSIFGEDIALTETLEWLKDLKFKSLENSSSDSTKLLSSITDFINQDDLLPGGVTMKSVSSNGIIFEDSFGSEVTITDLSDGFRSILSMMLELIRQLVQCYETTDIFDERCSSITKPGVVFIDEVDVHLHPSWQREIGLWLTTHFPKIQFIVTTHSPLICQSATSGSIWILPSVNSKERHPRVTGVQYERLLYGNILEALSSGAFGEGIERSDEAIKLLEELAQLNMKSNLHSLTEDEHNRKEHLSKIFPASEL